MCLIAAAGLVAPYCGGGARAHLRSTPAALSSRRFCGPQRGRLSRAAACCGPSRPVCILAAILPQRGRVSRAAACCATRSWVLVRAFPARVHSGLVRLLGASPGLLRLIAAYCRNKRLVAVYCRNKPWRKSRLERPIAAYCFPPGNVPPRKAEPPPATRVPTPPPLREASRRRLQRGAPARLIAPDCGSLRLVAAYCGSLRLVAVYCGWYAPRL